MALVALCSLLVLIICRTQSEMLLEWVNTPADMMSFQIPMMLLYSVGSSFVKGIGDSKSPFYILLISNVVNLLLDVVFLSFLDMVSRVQRWLLYWLRFFRWHCS